MKNNSFILIKLMVALMLIIAMFSSCSPYKSNGMVVNKKGLVITKAVKHHCVGFGAHAHKH
jgi:hypothetical protein